jgi:pilus assembly protein CpaE
MAEVAKSIRRGGLHSLDEFLVQHVSGIRVSAEPLGSSAAGSIRPADVDEIFDRLMQSFDVLVVDAPKQFDDMQLLVLDRAEIILFVTGMDVPALRSARRSFDLYHRMGVDMDKIRVLLNRYVKIESTGVEAVERILGAPVFWTLPDNYRAVIRAVNQGLPLATSDEKSGIAKSYAGLSKALLRLLEASRE